MTTQLALALPPGVVFDSGSLTIPPGLTLPELMAVGGMVKQCTHAALFWRADWLREVRRSQGDAVAVECCQQLELDQGTMRDMERLAGCSGRNGRLTPEHHFAILRIPSDQHQQWLDIAEREKLSPRELQRSAKAGIVLRDEIPSRPPSSNFRFATIEGIAAQFDLWHRQIEDEWQDWSDDTVASFLKDVAKIEDFIAEVRRATLSHE